MLCRRAAGNGDRIPSRPREVRPPRIGGVGVSAIDATPDQEAPVRPVRRDGETSADGSLVGDRPPHPRAAVRDAERDRGRRDRGEAVATSSDSAGSSRGSVPRRDRAADLGAQGAAVGRSRARRRAGRFRQASPSSARRRAADEERAASAAFTLETYIHLLDDRAGVDAVHRALKGTSGRP